MWGKYLFVSHFLLTFAVRKDKDMDKYYDINVYTIGEIISMVLGENEK